jgi:hypothetical protein
MMSNPSTLAQIAGTLATLAETLKAELIASDLPSDRISKLEKELYEAEEERNVYRERWQEATDELDLAKALREHFKELLDRTRTALADAMMRDHRDSREAWTGTEEDAVLMELEKLREQRAEVADRIVALEESLKMAEANRAAYLTQWIFTSRELDKERANQAKLQERRADALSKAEEILQHRTRYAISDTALQLLNELYKTLLPLPRDAE